MKIIYIAGPYNGVDQQTVEANIERARDAQIRFANIGIFAFCPHQHSANYHLEGLGCEANEQFWIESYLEMVKRCDGLYALKGWQASRGSLAEMNLAVRGMKKIFFQETDNMRDIVMWSRS